MMDTPLYLRGPREGPLWPPTTRKNCSRWSNAASLAGCTRGIY